MDHMDTLVGTCNKSACVVYNQHSMYCIIHIIYTVIKQRNIFKPDREVHMVVDFIPASVGMMVSSKVNKIRCLPRRCKSLQVDD